MADLNWGLSLAVVGGGGGGGSNGKDGVGIASLEINKNGELIVSLDDGRVKNLGRIVGEDGAVYVPHIDEHKILTFTIEKDPSEIPPPVDLNPNDEWNDIGEDGIESPGLQTDYVWEDI